MNQSPDEKLYQEVQNEFFDRKRSSFALSESYRRLGMDDRADKVDLCGTDLWFSVPVDGSDDAKLFQANFCKDRLCWMCSWRRTRKIFGQVSQVMDKIELEGKYRFVFVTLTLRSCSGPELLESLDHLLQSFHRFNQRARIKKAFKGGFRTVEVTYHPENPSRFMFHHHMHVIYACNKSYFKSRDYINHDELMELWRECAGIDYDPYVHIEIVKPTVSEKDEITFKQAVAEVAKYTVKPEQIYIGRSDDEIDYAVLHLSNALRSRRICAFTGIFKNIAKELDLDDMLDGDLINTDNEKLRTDVQHVLIHYKWNVGWGYERTLVTLEKNTKKERKEQKRADRGARSRVSAKLWREKVAAVNAERISRKPV